jgi:Glutaredoxin and related proteins
MPEITVYTRTTCGPCRTLKGWLKNKSVNYNEKSCDDPSIERELIGLTGMMIVPTTVVNGEVVMGQNIGRISELLTRVL